MVSFVRVGEQEVQILRPQTLIYVVTVVSYVRTVNNVSVGRHYTGLDMKFLPASCTPACKHRR